MRARLLVDATWNFRGRVARLDRLRSPGGYALPFLASLEIIQKFFLRERSISATEAAPQQTFFHFA